MIKILLSFLVLATTASASTKDEIIQSVIEERNRIYHNELFIFRNDYECKIDGTKFTIESYSKIKHAVCIKHGTHIEPDSRDVYIDTGTLWYLIPHNIPTPDGVCEDKPCLFDEAMDILEPVLAEIKRELLEDD